MLLEGEYEVLIIHQNRCVLRLFITNFRVQDTNNCNDTANLIVIYLKIALLSYRFKFFQLMA